MADFFPIITEDVKGNWSSDVKSQSINRNFAVGISICFNRYRFEERE